MTTTSPAPLDNRLFYALVAIGLLLNATGLLVPIIEPDDALYATLPKTMVETGDWVRLYVFGRDWLDKPHFQFWMTAISYSLFGVSSFAYKLPALLFFFGGVYYTYLFARLARNGTWVQVAQSTGTGSKTIARRMVVDAAGNVVVAGEYDGPTRFGSLRINLASRGNFVPFVARLSANGTWTQVTQAENTSDSCAADALVLDGNDNVWLAGRFKSPVISFGSTTFTNSDPNAYTTNHFDLFIAQLSSAGNWTFATAVASALPQALALNRGQATLVGNFNSSVAFGTTTLTSSAQVTGFLATLNGGVLPTLTPAPADPAGLAWPNPAGSYTTVSLPATAAPRPVQLFDALGREVRRLELPARATSLKMNLVGLPSGCYLLRCGTSSGRLLVD